MTDRPPLSAQELELLRSFDTPTICNVIELFGVQSQTAGYMDTRIQCCFPKMPPMVGYASTATIRSAAPPDAGGVAVTMDRQVEAFAQIPAPPVVVIQDLDDPTRAATFGEVMCTTYKAFGAVGVITSGAARDLDQVAALGFAAFASGTICSHGYPQMQHLHVPVNVGGLTIHPGDLLHGDRNGVTTIPLRIAAEVARACQPFVDAEQRILTYLSTSEPTVAGYGAVLKQFNAAKQQICQGVSGQQH